MPLSASLRQWKKCLRLVHQLSTQSWSKFPMVSSSVISSPFRTRFFSIHFDKKSPCELYFAYFSFKRFIFIASQSVLWFCSGAAVKRFELTLSSSYIVTGLSLVVGKQQISQVVKK